MCVRLRRRSKMFYRRNGNFRFILWQWQRTVVSSRCLNWNSNVCDIVGNWEMIIHHEPAVSVVIVTVVINSNDTEMAHDIMLLLHLLCRPRKAHRNTNPHTRKKSSPTLTMRTFKKCDIFVHFFSSCFTCQYALFSRRGFRFDRFNGFSVSTRAKVF